MKIYMFFRGSKSSESSIVICGVVYSFILTVITRLLDDGILARYDLSEWGLLVVPVILAVIFAFIAVGLVRTRLFRWVLHTVDRKSVDGNIWDQIIDYQHGTAMAVKLKDEDILYIGDLVTIEENGLDSWFTLSNYRRLGFRTGIVEYDSTLSTEKTVIVLNMRDVESVQLLYADGSTLYPGR